MFDPNGVQQIANCNVRFKWCATDRINASYRLYPVYPIVHIVIPFRIDAFSMDSQCHRRHVLIILPIFQAFQTDFVSSILSFELNKCAIESSQWYSNGRTRDDKN
eukprot:360912_1